MPATVGPLRLVPIGRPNQVTPVNVGLFEDGGYRNLLPLTWLRACFELRCGIDRLIDKVRTHLGPAVARLWLRPELREVVSERIDLDPPKPDDDWCLLNGRTLLTAPVAPPAVGTGWQINGALIAAGVRAADIHALSDELFLSEESLGEFLRQGGYRLGPPPASVSLINYPWELVLANEAELRRQCQYGGIQEGRVYPGVHLLNPTAIHVARGAVVKPGVVLDAEEGPIQIDEGARIEPNAVIQGPAHIGSQALVRPGTVIRPGSSIGPACRVGGEISLSVLHGYSNKQHNGFLGHSYVGEWVNLGADTVTSNLKNTYGTIRVYINGVGVESGQHFVGSIIADHAKTGIGTLLPTGAVVGVASNVLVASGVPKFVPSFAWLTEAGLSSYQVDKAIHIARTVMARREVHLSDAEERLLNWVAGAARQTEAAGWK